ncbi:uncharacterized protein LOC120123147 [Hibiscus syriacus]|uniref:uncharacterized protein LOC120123147 n=1 Tax=Hibiscus syriacus TaxID=106335 RepID=UPI00192264B6|nr:uncharacterized protein LOC120123147 [Hibiscus syriacus]
MKFEAVPKLAEHDVPSGKLGIASDLTSTISSTPYPSSGTNQDLVGEPGAKQSTGFDNYYYPGYDGSFTQSDDKGYFLSDGSHTVNGSGQFVGLAEMVGKVNFNKDMEFWQLDKWNGFFPLKWHVIKDIPNKDVFHIILENNEIKPVTHSRDTQEVLRFLLLLANIVMFSVLKSAPEALGKARRLEESLRPPRRLRVHEAAIQSSEAARGDEAMRRCF